MVKKFCITGTCVPEKNYMVDISDRIDRITKDYIEQGQYFTINRARQYGKTTTFFSRTAEKEISEMVAGEGISGCASMVSANVCNISSYWGNYCKYHRWCDGIKGRKKES